MMLPGANQPNTTMLVLECGLAGLAIASAFAFPGLGGGLFRRIERVFARLAQRRGVSVVVVGLSVILLRLAILPLYPVPLPFAPDDFSFLLAADTFAHGRLTNATPAMWTHLESIHITMLPTYQSMYFPGQGLLLAASKAVFGNPWIGLLLVSALMCAAICWMLQAWMPANWALLGGFIAVIRLGVFSYWTNTYHAGGSLCALSGALVLGSLPRLMKTHRLRYAWLMGVGMATLAITRPYDGCLLCLPVTVALIHWAWKGKKRPRPVVLARLTAAVLAPLIVAVAWMAYYDDRAFGNPLTPPYAVNRATYAIAPYFVWQQPKPEPAYRHAAIRSFYEKAKGEMGFYTQIHSLKGFIPRTFEKVAFTFLFYAGFALLIPLLMARRVFLDRRMRFLTLSMLVLAAGMVIEIYLLAHYVSPYTAAFYAIGLQMMRHLRVWKPEGKPAGLAMARFAVTVCVLMAGLRLCAQPLDIAAPEWPPSNWNFTWYGPEHYGEERAQIEKRLEQTPGGQLAIVRYGSDHNPLDEWVYNGADIDGSKVVWAREMGAEDNRELIHYYGNRQVWLVEPDAIPARITPYPMTEETAGK